MATTRPYEVVVIIDSSLDDQVIEGVVKRTVGTITTQGGSAGRIERWGRRKLAYDINKKSEGYYVVIEASMVPSTVAELDRLMHLSDEVMRHKVMLIPAKSTGRTMTNPPSLDEIATAQREARASAPRQGRGRDRGDRD
jgi:small subunit ribosomal protein S6